MDDLDILAVARRVIRANGAAVLAAESALGDAFLRACHVLVESKGKVLVTGSGTSGAIASRAAHLLSVAGTPAFYLSPTDGVHGGLGVLRAEDSVIAISKGGSSAELNEFSRRARSLAHCLIVITASHDSELASLADHILPLTLPADADLGAIIATGSSLSTAALLDAITEVTRMMRGYRWDQVIYTHPAGAVGRDGPAIATLLDEE
ncbi:SIS domain-containing protein [Acidisoma silvae]|uniref:SIS domain-containing protein n=1 Tax=Acidisoma silvae TaxID=2802396 RepID=A0A963YWL2_9PROT|nr:SIS domain-containing protein [Acidisoma silvae]MCB8878184.1 SIS domain-containing protein [Acidisoma silvae]